ncbi:hypothetical protein LOK74_05590 [Brevibacillus humidisoli]|uniref:hypothetical protein n=1 Tax=Brevibacillus humidisoli TaxID=2895522 RepID=UPI001E2966C9|nr:hypothetical protein [Brevibacillus humidisoli]UFJ41975.1 hypothetical protein LOK74_05590 [Brevibacillus humidisoli]
MMKRKKRLAGALFSISISAVVHIAGMARVVHRRRGVIVVAASMMASMMASMVMIAMFLVVRFVVAIFFVILFLAAGLAVRLMAVVSAFAFASHSHSPPLFRYSYRV